MCSLRSIEPWVVCIAESCWSLANLCLLTSRGGKRIWESRWLTNGNPPCGWARATSRASIWSEPTKDLYTREAFDDSLNTAGQKKTSVQLSQHHRSRRRHWTSRLQLNLSVFLVHHQKYPKMGRRNPQQNQRKTKKCRRERGVSSSGKGENRTETQENMSVKKRVMMKSPKLWATSVSPPDDLVK